MHHHRSYYSFIPLFCPPCYPSIFMLPPTKLFFVSAFYFVFEMWKLMLFWMSFRPKWLLSSSFWEYSLKFQVLQNNKTYSYKWRHVCTTWMMFFAIDCVIENCATFYTAHFLWPCIFWVGGSPNILFNNVLLPLDSFSRKIIWKKYPSCSRGKYGI